MMGDSRDIVEETSDEDVNVTITKEPSQLTKYEENYDIPKTLWDWERIPDWQKRLAGYTAEQKKFYENMVPKIQEMKGCLASETGWTLLVDSHADQVNIQTKKSIRDLTMMRATGPIDWPAKDVLRCMCYHPLRKEWDVNNDVLHYT